MSTVQRMPANDSVSTTPSSGVGNAGGRQTGEEGFLALLVQMFVRAAQGATPPAGAPPAVTGVPGSVEWTPNEPATSSPECTYFDTAEDTSSFEVVSQLPPAAPGMEQTQFMIETDIPPVRDLNGRDETTRSVPRSPRGGALGQFGNIPRSNEIRWNEPDDGSSFEVIAKAPGNGRSILSHESGRVAEAGGALSGDRTTHPSTASAPPGVNPVVPSVDLNGKSVGVSIRNYDDIIRWEVMESRMDGSCKPEQVEAYMKVESELRAVAGRFSLRLPRVMPANEVSSFISSPDGKEPVTAALQADAQSPGEDAASTSDGVSGLTDGLEKSAATPQVVGGNHAQLIADHEQGDGQDWQSATHADQSLPPDGTAEFQPAVEKNAGERTAAPPNAGFVHSGPKVDFISETQTRSASHWLPEDFGSNMILKASDGLRLHREGKSGGVHVVLSPESLGELSIRITMEEGKLAAHMRVQEPSVKAALEAQIPQLREALASQGIEVQRFEIVSGGSGMQFDDSDEGRAFHQRPRSKGPETVDAAGEYDVMRNLGYNTIEYII